MDESQQSERDEAGSGQHKRLSNRDVAAELALIGDILQILDANRFRVIAFQNAAEAIRTFGQDVNALYAEGKLQTIPGVGKGIADAVHELLKNGEAKDFEELKAKVPRGVVEIVQLPDVGPKTAKRLWEELNITSVPELKAAAEGGKAGGFAHTPGRGATLGTGVGGALARTRGRASDCAVGSGWQLAPLERIDWRC